jgi:hypothetical protein
MATVEQQPVEAPWRPGVPTVALLAGLVVGTTAMYAFGQLLPWWQNGFAGQPHDSWSLGAQDPKDIWPAGTPLAGWVSTAGWLSLLAVPLVAFGGGLVAAAVALNTARQGRWRLAAVCALTVAACVALAGFHVSPLGQALTSWRLD